MYKSPAFEVASWSSLRHQLVLIASRGQVPKDLLQQVPAHLREHAALRGDKGAKLVLHGNKASTLVLGIGKARDFTPQEAAEWGENAGQTLVREHLGEVQVVFCDEAKDYSIALNFAKGLAMANYRMDELKTGSQPKRGELSKIVLPAGGPIGKADLPHLAAVAEGIGFARTVMELPPCEASPAGIVERFQGALKNGLIELEVWDEKRIKKEGMGLLEAVSRGSAVPPRFLIARYGRTMAKHKPTLFYVGKGVTFDTGGINLKTTSWLDLLDMKKDMGGAAAVLGALVAISRLKVGIPVTVLTPLTVNAIDGNAVLPGDVIKSYSGKTVEIMNTDAEGRLILADALTYAIKQKADYIVDVATLTGACAVALGKHHSGLFTNSDAWGDRILKVTEHAGEPAWKMPMSPRYGDELKSKVADFANMGRSREGGAQIGAKFMERFVEGVPWTHLDIAGTHDLGEPAGNGAAHHSAGRMVHSLVLLAQQMAESSSSGSKKKGSEK